MLNWIWLGMILVATLVGGFGGRLEPMTTGALEQAKDAVMSIALPFIGAWAVWLGMMRLAERAGLVQALARVLRPVLCRLFPDVPPEHPAMGAMVLSVAANMLGLGNAATPLGLRAMAHLNRLNGQPGVASNSMVTFLVMCTASIQLLPTTAITVLALDAMKRKLPNADPTSIVAPALIATICALAVGLFLAKWLATWRMFAAVPDPEATGVSSEIKAEEVAAETVQPAPLTTRGKIVLLLFLGSFLAMFGLLVWPHGANGLLHQLRGHEGGWAFAVPWPESPQDTASGILVRTIRAISLLAIPFMLSFFPLYAGLRGVKVYEQFCEGAKEAFGTAQRVIPYLVAMLVAIRLLRESGALGMMTEGLRPWMAMLYFPPEILPLALMRPLSGGASQGIMMELVSTHGAHSLIGKMAATIYGSTETTFYVIAVYFGSVGVRQARHAVIAGLAADITALIVSVAACNWLLG
jgi:spore maturation protein SpmA